MNYLKYLKKKIRFAYKVFLLILFISQLALSQNENSDISKNIPPKIKFIRVYGGDNESYPPIVLMKSAGASVNPPFGEENITIEFDVEANVPPSFYARFVHCSATWDEDDNVFLNDITVQRTSNIEWQSAPAHSTYYQWRGKLKVPNTQIKFNQSGNWKVKFYEYYNDSVEFGEAKFFVLQPKTSCELNIYADFYDPEYKVTQSALTFEAIVTGKGSLYNNQMNTVTIYQNNRWEEPYYITNNNNPNDIIHKYRFPINISGFPSAGKIFRIEQIPSQNSYRILDLTNLAEYPTVNAPVRFPFADYRRYGAFADYDNDGAMITDAVTVGTDDYVNVDFVMDPDGWISEYEVYPVGSFNNWSPDITWQMYYDASDRFYKVRHWVRRAKHNYLYAIGKFNNDTKKVEKIAFDEYEGNTSGGIHTFLAFVYYREFDFGGYDALIGLGSSNVYGSIIR